MKRHVVRFLAEYYSAYAELEVTKVEKMDFSGIRRVEVIEGRGITSRI